MARPLQHVYRRRQLHGGEDDEEVEDGQGYPKAQALPIADLPENFDGEVEDGATYLALANRANSALPFVTRVPNPYHQPSPEPPRPAGHSSPGRDAGDIEMPTSGSEAGPSRHPALPKGSWEVLFPLHFVGYRKHLADLWHPSPPRPYPTNYPPIPASTLRSEWYCYINGYPRKKIKKRKELSVEAADEEAMMNAPTSEERAAGEVEAIVDGEVGISHAPHEMEDEEERHRPREPLTEITRILSHITLFLNESIDRLSTHEYLPTQPSAPSTPSTSSPSPTSPPPNPFPSRYGRWIFALLCVLDSQLSGSEISILRELARAAMKVGAWQWIRAVTLGEITQDDGWTFGERWKAARNARPSASGIGELAEDDETGVDETLARCWIVVHAVAAGWGQRDLVQELHTFFT